jgi:tetraprenyl-beta-curcumene synthase
VCGHTSTPHRGVSHSAFLYTAARYWTGVFPFACREIRTCERAARVIPDAKLRTIALRALREERGNLEGAAAYAAFAPRRYRVAVARAAMAFQGVYDFADAVSEQPGDRHAHDTRRLHGALLVALDPGASHTDYYAYPQSEDGGYLNRLVERCQAALCQLPSLPIVASQMRRAATRIIAYQCLNHQNPTGSYDSFARWARAHAAPGSDLRWWETGAAAGSSLSVFALISAAAEPHLDAGHAAALEHAYFPWIGSLHTLLDSLVDEREDTMTGQHCLIARYSSHAEVDERLRSLAARAADHAKALPDAENHMMLLAAMVSFYLAGRHANNPRMRLTADGVLRAFGSHALPAMVVLRFRHALSNLAHRRLAGVSHASGDES